MEVSEFLVELKALNFVWKKSLHSYAIRAVDKAGMEVNPFTAVANEKGKERFFIEDTARAIAFLGLRNRDAKAITLAYNTFGYLREEGARSWEIQKWMKENLNIASSF